MEKIVVLDNVRSAHNVGAIFRTCDGAGVSKIYLCGYTPAPLDRFGRVQPEIKKTSLSATESVVWESVEDITELIGRLHGDGYTTATIEQCSDSMSYKEWRQLGPTAFIFGNEIDGVQKTAREKSDVILEIPMHGQKESLNVSTAAGIILFHF